MFKALTDRQAGENENAKKGCMVTLREIGSAREEYERVILRVLLSLM